MTTLFESASRDLSTKTKSERLVALRDAVDALPADQKTEFQEVLGMRVGEPDPTTSNRVWLIIIWAFAVVMIGAVVAMSVSMFVAPVKDGTKPETLLTVFTTVTAFLGGLFAPSPIAKK